MSLYSLKKYEEAIKFFNKSIEIKPNNLNALKYKFEILFELTKYEEAIQCLDKIIEIQPNDAI